MIISILVVAGLGLVISAYAFMVEKRMERDSSYKPACDLSDRVSCSKPIRSEYGKLFGMNNALFGIIFYAGMMVLAWFDASTLLFYAALAACCVSLYLEYILFFKIRSLCIVCMTIYGVNALLLVLSYLHY